MPKIADFGLSQTRLYSIQSLKKMSPGIPWCAPEILTGGKITEKSDIFSLGVILWEIFTGERPFAEVPLLEQTQKILAGQYSPLTDGIPEEIKKIITSCWAKKPADRPELREIISQTRPLNLKDLFIEEEKMKKRPKL